MCLLFRGRDKQANLFQIVLGMLADHFHCQPQLVAILYQFHLVAGTDLVHSTMTALAGKTVGDMKVPRALLFFLFLHKQAGVDA